MAKNNNNGKRKKKRRSRRTKEGEEKLKPLALKAAPEVAQKYAMNIAAPVCGIWEVELLKAIQSTPCFVFLFRV